MGVQRKKSDNTPKQPPTPPIGGMTKNPCMEGWVDPRAELDSVEISHNTGFDPPTFQPIATFSLQLTKRMHIRWSHLERERESRWHFHSMISVRGTVFDIDRYIMVKMVRLILFVSTRIMERYDVCTFDRNRRTTWNWLKSEEGWQLW